jgi:outer membrane protein assembly factor BamA
MTPPPFLTRSLLVSLLVSVAGCHGARAQSSAAHSSPATAYKLIAVKVTGTKRFTSAEVAAASGLPVGTVAHEEDFRKAARQLGESGAFANIAFTFSYSSAGTKLEFQVTEADKFVPVSFRDFVWFTDEELLRKVHERVPLFNGELPAAGRLPEQVSDVLQALLVEHGIPGRVEFLRKADKSEHLQSFEYNVAGVSIRILRVEFPGAGTSELTALETAAERLSDREYSREFMNSFIEGSVLRIYRERGFINAVCAPPQPKIVKPTDSRSSEGPQASFVDVLFQVTPGIQYKLRQMEWSGNKEFPTETLQPLVRAKIGQPANTVQLEEDMKSVRELYGSRGYILASIKVEAHFDDAAGAVTLHLMVDEGSVYRMGELEFRGIGNDLTARLRAAWKMRPGEVYDATYLKPFLVQARKLLPVNVDWEVDPHVTAITRDKTVDVDLQYTAKATQ